MIYKDPIVILINGIRLQQASFFAALQDYNRALGTGTLGKATIQSIMALEKMMIKICENKY
jgi:C-terminal processing protease CtpA/Prc